MYSSKKILYGFIVKKIYLKPNYKKNAAYNKKDFYIWTPYHYVKMADEMQKWNYFQLRRPPAYIYEFVYSWTPLSKFPVV